MDTTLESYVVVVGSERPLSLPEMPTGDCSVIALVHATFFSLTPRRPAIFRPDAPASFMALPHWKQSKIPKVGTSKATELGDRAEEDG